LKIPAVFLVFLIFSLNCQAQNFELKLTGIDESESKILDSLNYIKNHLNIKSIQDEVTLASDKLSKQGYLENQFLEKIKLNDSTYSAKFRLGKKIKFIHIYIGKIKLYNPTSTGQPKKINKEEKQIKNENSLIKNLIEWETKNDTIKIPFTEVESFLDKSIQKLEKKGYAFAKLKLGSFNKINTNLNAELQFELGKARALNSIIINYKNTDKTKSFPKGHLAQIKQKYRNRVFNSNSVDDIYEDFEKFKFISQLKYPEILFTNDSTKVYVYLNDKKSNTFDGFIGFTNNESNKVKLNGYLDVRLENTLKAGEQFTLYWKNNGNDQKTFSTGIEIPYLFKSPLGIKAQISIFKQDSIFQNTKTEIDLGYYIDYNTRLFLGYQATESSDIQNTNTKTISDYKNSFISTNLEYLKSDTRNSNFPIKSSLSANFGVGKRTSNEFSTNAGTIKQGYIKIQAMHNFYLNPKNCININFHNYFLKSDSYVTNELFRFGGIQTIRGFAENIFQANFMTAFQSEYRHIISSNLYFHTILDYCYFQDESLDNKQNLTGIGLGIGLNTKTGLLKFAFANGNIKNQTIQLSNTIIHINYVVRF
jgi:hypothetical protein